MSKGSSQRQKFISDKDMQDNWDRIFQPKQLRKKHTKLRSKRK